jgi:hypothetical protein
VFCRFREERRDENPGGISMMDRNITAPTKALKNVTGHVIRASILDSSWKGQTSYDVYECG